MKQKMTRWGCAMLLALCAALGLIACGGSAKSSNFIAETAAGRGSNEPIPAENAALDIEYDRAALTDSNSLSPPVPDGRKLIRTVDMSVETDGFDPFIKTLTDKISALGGYVEQSDISGNRLNYHGEPIPRHASLTVRIPSDQLDHFITVVEANGNVTNKSQSTQDVTLQYSDLESRKKSLTVEQERLWALLEKADTLESVIALEERLSEIRYQLESMESQLRLYDNQVDYSSLHLAVIEIVDETGFTPAKPRGFGQRIREGFAKNLKSVTQGLTDFVIWLAASSPIWVPLVAIAAVILLVLKRRAKRSPRKERQKKGKQKKEPRKEEQQKDEQQKEEPLPGAPENKG